MEKRFSGRPYFLSPDELAEINLDYQMQCRIYEHVMDYALDYHKVPKDFR